MWNLTLTSQVLLIFHEHRLGKASKVLQVKPHTKENCCKLLEPDFTPDTLSGAAKPTV